MSQKKIKKETPLMKQYNAIKRKYPDALLLFRVGDFYETFGDDAVKSSKILDIVLTKRANGAASKIELAGFPHHALDSYLPKLVKAGNRVAICDQLENPKMVKGIVKRGVTELVTPGISNHDGILEKKNNNYLCAVSKYKENYGVSFLDFSTGEFFLASGSQASIKKFIFNFRPKEILYPRNHKHEFLDIFEKNYNLFPLEDWIFTHDFGYEKLIQLLHVRSLKGYGIEQQTEGIMASGAILHYLDETQHKQLSHISTISRIDESLYVWLDPFTVKSLELLESNHPDGKSLCDVIDHTATPMGKRLLKKWILFPQKNIDEINRRLEVVTFFVKNFGLLQNLSELLSGIDDIERLVGKLATQRINPRELFQLSKNLEAIQELKNIISDESTLQSYAIKITPCHDLMDKLKEHLKEHPPLQLHQGNVIAQGVNDELDELRKIAKHGKDYLENVKKREISNTGINSLKISYNKIFGYYIEVSNTHKDRVPKNWIRKQTLVNSERYITEELKDYEEKILTAESKIQFIEQKLYEQLVQHTASYSKKLQRNAKTIAEIDCLHSFANHSEQNNYHKPVISDDYSIDIKEGRHPVIEKTLDAGEEYVPNDIILDNNSHQILVITGPNMSGKSAFLRQTALITLLAQMGSYVPAKKARLGIIDKIFTRVGASDNISKGESTFMVEMNETASILNNLSERSLILMDEIGRGTSTYDGISIAYAIIDYLHNNKKCRPKTLFATHYHELTELANTHSRVKNYNVAVKELTDSIIFLRKLEKGSSEHSFGIHVAQMAGIPIEITSKANHVLAQLERKEGNTMISEIIPSQEIQMNLFEEDPRIKILLSILKKIDIDATSPVEALLKINEMKNILNRKNKGHNPCK